MRIVAVVAMALLVSGCDKQRIRECQTIPVAVERTVPTREPIPAALIEAIPQSWVWPVNTWGEALDAAQQCNIAFSRCESDRAALRRLESEKSDRQ